MGLTGNTNGEKIWNYLIDAGLTKAGAAGLMGNLYKDSGLEPGNLQNSYENKLSYTDEEYTAAVDSGTYAKDKFISDSAGYGLAQWTYSARKKALYEATVGSGSSIGDLKAQLDFLVSELRNDYPAVWKSLISAKDVQMASDMVLTKFEKPADQSDHEKDLRARYGLCCYDKYA